MNTTINLMSEVFPDPDPLEYRSHTIAVCPCHSFLEKRHWVMRGYNRLPKKGGGQGFELHGGATLEERLVPVIIFSRTGDFVPKAKTDVKRAQIVEKEDFDL